MDVGQRCVCEQPAPLHVVRAVQPDDEGHGRLHLRERLDEVARGLVEAFNRIDVKVPFVVRLDGTNDKEGRQILADAALPNVHAEATMLGAAKKVVELAG